MTALTREQHVLWAKRFKRLWCRICQGYQPWWIDERWSVICHGCGSRLIADAMIEE